MGLRDSNTSIDHDLAIIIDTFERQMIQSRDEAAIFSGFRADLEALENTPASILVATDVLPIAQGDLPSIPSMGDALDSELSVAELSQAEETEDSGDWQEKVKDWIEDCWPCDFRSWSKFNPDLLDDMVDDWKRILDGIWNSLKEFENLLDGTDVFQDICSIANSLKFHCVPDLMKILWLLNFMMTRLDQELTMDLSMFDNLLMSILAPIFNQLAANVSLLGDLALGPIQCIMDQLIFAGQQGQGDMASAWAAVQPFRGPTTSRREEATLSSERRRQIAEQEERERAGLQRSQAELGRVTTALQDIRRETGTERLTGYMRQGMQIVKNYQDWLMGLLKEMIDDRVLSQWNQRVSSAATKLDLLRFAGIIKATIEAALDGKISCGPDEDGYTEEEFRELVSTYLNPLSPLEISVEDDILYITASSAEVAKRQEEVGHDEAEKLPNIVFQKPISSCLKKVTNREAEQVLLWIKEQEEDLAD